VLTRAGADAAHVERQPDHAAGIAAAQIGLDHALGERLRIAFRLAGCDEGAGDKGSEPFTRNSRVVLQQTAHAPCASRGMA
jgi:hypothetical protein